MEGNTEYIRGGIEVGGVGYNRGPMYLSSVTTSTCEIYVTELKGPHRIIKDFNLFFVYVFEWRLLISYWKKGHVKDRRETGEIGQKRNPPSIITLLYKPTLNRLSATTTAPSTTISFYKTKGDG